MHTFKIKKRSGGYREIYSPSAREKKEFRSYLPYLESLHLSPYAHAFVKHRNIITNAQHHIRYNISVSFDLSSFFDTVTEKSFKNIAINKDILYICLVDGAARQGIPTSPILANIAANKMDYTIVKKLNALFKQKHEFSYTRYADDMTVSFNDKKNITTVCDIVSKSVEICGFTLNKKKTRVQFSTNGNRREICGVTVDNEIHTSRRFRRRLRAAEHRCLTMVDNYKNTYKQYNTGFETQKFLKISQTSEEAFISLIKQREIVKGMQEFALLKDKSEKVKEHDDRP